MEELEVVYRDYEWGEFTIRWIKSICRVVDCIEGVEEEIGFELNDMSNATYALPLVEDPKLAAKIKLEISSADAKKKLQTLEETVQIGGLWNLSAHQSQSGKEASWFDTE